MRGKTKIGIVGIISPETATSALPSIVKDLRFADPADVINERTRSLRARGADIVVVVAHQGGFCNTESNSASCTGDIFQVAPRITEKVDVMITAHTHGRVNTVAAGIPILQARSGGQAIDVVDIPLTPEGKRASGDVVADVRAVPVATTTPYAPIDSLVRAAIARVAPIINRRYATLTSPLNRVGNQYPFGNLVTDAQRWAGKGDVAIMNNHGLRTGIPAGEVTWGRLYEVQPFGNTLVRLRMTGAQLRAYMEKLLAPDALEVHVSGMTVGYDPKKPAGQRIASLQLTDGRTLADTESYSVIVNNFIAGGGSDMGPPKEAKATPLNIVDLDALVDYIKTLKSPITAPPEKRVFVIQ